MALSHLGGGGSFLGLIVAGREEGVRGLGDVTQRGNAYPNRVLAQPFQISLWDVRTEIAAIAPNR